jgi:mono/diheme cytochrome c family protein
MKLLLTSGIIFLALINYSRFHSPGTELQGESGSQLYAKYCLTCHQSDGKGVRGMFPPLAGNEKITGDPSEIIKIVLFGLEGPITVNEREYNMVMPPQNYLSDKQIADILTYVRSAWENKASPVSPGEVRKLRKTQKPEAS